MYLKKKNQILMPNKSGGERKANTLPKNQETNLYLLPNIIVTITNV